VWLLIKISDTGIGMAEDELENLFSGYGRIDATDNFYKGGTGLGLNISRQIAELMKGTLTATSEKNKGSVFTLCVPQKMLSEETIGKETAAKLMSFQYTKK
jgi:signal transduction histidine kinase